MSRIIKTSFADDGDDRTLGRLADALEQREPELRKVIGQPEEPDVTPTLDESDGGFVTPDRFFWKWMAVMAEKEYGKTQDQLDATGKSVRAAGGELGAVLRGGPGSGHFGHKGIPKHRGGSQPGDFHSAQGKKKPGTAHLTLDELMAAGKTETEAREAKFPSSETTAKMLDDLQIEADAALDQFAGRAAMTALGAEGDSTSWFLRLAVPNNGYSLVEQAQMAFGDDATDEQVQEIGRASARHLALMSMYEYERITKGAGFSSKKQAAKAEAFYQKMKALAEDTKDVPGLAEASNYKPPADAKPLFRGLDSRQVELVTGWMSQRDSGMDSRFDTAEQLYDALSRSTSMPSIPRDIHDTLIDNLGKELVGGNKKAVAWFEENRGPATVSNVVHALNAADRYQWVPEDAPEELRAIADEINVGWTRTNAVPTSILTAEVAAELWGGEAPGRDTYDSEDLGELHSQTTRFLKGVDATDYYDQMDRTGGREAARKFLEYQYAQTQDFFRRIGLDPDKDTMRLYRGVRDEHEGESTFGKWNPGGAMREEPTTVKTYSLASWASGVEDALKFAVPVPEGEDAPEHDAETGELTEEEMDYEVPLHNGFVMVADVPLSKVVAIAHTGFPCWFESEFVVMGGEGIPNARVVPMQDLYQGETTPRYFEEELLAKGEEEYYKVVEDVGSGPEGLIRYIRGEAEEQLKPKVDEWLGEERRISGDVHSVERSLTLTRRLTLRGGPGSGHFDHEGRPGEVGGSLPDDFHSAQKRRSYPDDMQETRRRIERLGGTVAWSKDDLDKLWDSNAKRRMESRLEDFEPEAREYWRGHFEEQVAKEIRTDKGRHPMTIAFDASGGRLMVESQARAYLDAYEGLLQDGAFAESPMALILTPSPSDEELDAFVAKHPTRGAFAKSELNDGAAGKYLSYMRGFWAFDYPDLFGVSGQKWWDDEHKGKPPAWDFTERMSATSMYSPIETGVILHEYGHHLDALDVFPSARKASQRLLSTGAGDIPAKNAYEKPVSDNISFYATTNRQELIAECYAMSRHPDYEAKATPHQREIINFVLNGGPAPSYLEGEE
jgi:hypothetical protein